ncbi:hypothetical protein DPEC_G00170580 [Dallia pectoralis]|uniref:Uncharacterized protein n=1 Tax=Dallia pectoralis TaxID=75939 RepID=A0ACC2GCV6_DALPE|nr:hypothetical protein DPEC_G00170580 [Dallia pectoralis]
MGLFKDSYCNICNAQLISKSQRVAHYESKKHANKVRLFYMLHPEDGGPPSKRLRPDNADSEEMTVDSNKCCSLCNMFFTSAVVAQSHYKGKTHAKRVRLILGSTLNIPTGTHTDDSTPCPSSTPPVLTPPSPAPPAPCLGTNDNVACRWCFLCGAWFNHPVMAQQHYKGKKHRRNNARARLLEQLADNLGTNPNTGLQSSYRCTVCDVTVNSIEQYHAHVQGSKHHTKSNKRLA